MKLGRSKLAVAAAGLIAAVLGVFMYAQTAYAAPAQMNFSGAPATVAANADITFNVVTAGATPDAYKGFNIAVSWSTTGGTVAFGSASNAGTVINSPFCPAPSATAVQVIYACTSLGASTTTSGQLASLTFNTTGTGCVTFHLRTFGAPDSGGAASGTYLVSAGPTPPANQPQSNPLGSDIQVAMGSPTACQQGGGGTATPPSEETATPTRVVRTATPTPGGETPVPTDTSVPVETATSAPASPVPASPTPVGGGAGAGGLQPPDTGSGGGSAGSDMNIFWVIALGGAGLAAATGGALVIRMARR